MVPIRLFVHVKKKKNSWFPYLLAFQSVFPFSKLFLSFRILSFSLFINAICGSLIIAGKYILFKRTKQNEKNSENLGRIYKTIGILITLVSISFVLYSTSFFSLEYQPKTFSLIAGISIALLTLIELIIAISGIVASRKKKDILTESFKQINLVSAIISISLTQSALLSLAHGDSALIYYNQLSSIFWGMIICMIGIKMILLSNRSS